MRALSVVVVAHDAGMELVGCLGSLRDRAGRAPEIVLVLNGTVAPEVGNAARFIASRVIVPDDNIGFAAACNLGARHATGDVLVFLNPDTLASPAAVRRLARTLEDPSIGIATARLRLLREPELLNSSGNVLHITGLGWVGGYRERAEDAPDAREVAFPSGAAMAIRADVFRDLGGFREELFLYHEDVDLGWRAHLRGLRVVMTPTADVYHDYSFDRNPRKHYFLERNRLSFLVCDFSARMLLLLAPVLVAAELAMLVLAWREGWVRQKAAGWMWCLRNLPALIRRRRETQRDRRVSDRDLAGLLTAVIDPRVLKVPAAIRFVNPLLVGYWALVKRAL
jgi:GT2 family glycosyltransferase